MLAVSNSPPRAWLRVHQLTAAHLVRHAGALTVSTSRLHLFLVTGPCPTELQAGVVVLLTSSRLRCNASALLRWAWRDDACECFQTC